VNINVSEPGGIAMIHMITLDTNKRDEMIDITCEITRLIEQEKVIQGCAVFIPLIPQRGLRLMRMQTPMSSMMS
jgi:hypothetical protein